ncbi:hypothetical protein LCGC14_2351050, partial [marine sediment metagenome]
NSPLRVAAAMVSAASWGDNTAYVLGLFCADGNMSKSSNNINICLHKNDAYLIKKIYNIMGSTHRVYYDKNVAKFCVDNKHLYNDLLKLGITPNKSKTLKCPNIPKEFVPHFIRGVMDGDGSVDTKRKRMKIVSASQDFIKGMSGMLKNLEIEHKVYNEPYILNYIKTDFYILRVLRRKDIKNLYHLMYKNQRLYLTRKKEAFEKMGIRNEDFDTKCKSRWRAVIGTHIETGKKIKFNSIKETCENGFCKPHLHKALNGKSTHHKGYTWKYALGE